MASSTTALRILAISILISLSAFGAYCTFGAAAKNGLFAAITKASGPNAEPKYFPGGPVPYKTTYTGIAALDDKLVTLIAVFTAILDGPKTEDVSWVSRYLMLQFLAGWTLISLEGLRQGNRGRIVSWTGTVGFVFQNITYTVTAPLYLVVHLITSPISHAKPLPSALSVDADDLVTLPFVITSAFVVPTIMMSLPSPAFTSPSAHYGWNAMWQGFPVFQSIYHFFYKRIFVTPFRLKNVLPVKVTYIYGFALVLAVVSQSTLLALATTPAHLLPDTLLECLPGVNRETLAQVDFARAFVPYWPWSSPKVDAESMSPAGEGLAELVKLFLQWDIYCGGLAVLVWAIYAYCVALPGKGILSGVALKVVFWTVLGGPVGAATALLWERDTVLQDQVADKKAE